MDYITRIIAIIRQSKIPSSLQNITHHKLILSDPTQNNNKALPLHIMKILSFLLLIALPAKLINGSIEFVDTRYPQVDRIIRQIEATIIKNGIKPLPEMEEDEQRSRMKAVCPSIWQLRQELRSNLEPLMQRLKDKLSSIAKLYVEEDKFDQAELEVVHKIAEEHIKEINGFLGYEKTMNEYCQ